jgi:hypothetical protein
LPILSDFVDKVKIIKPNLHLLSESLHGMDINTLTLEWSFPFVRATSLPPEIDLKSLCPHLAYLTVKEDGVQSDHCLPFFRGLSLPKRLRVLDLSKVHFPKNEVQFRDVLIVARGMKTIFCSCCHEFTKDAWENKWKEVDCLFFSSPNNQVCENT